jgi:excisionase family DNA binding protein
MRRAESSGKKPPARVESAENRRLLVGRREAAELLSISQRALDYLLAQRQLPTRRVGGRVLIPMDDLRRFARADHLAPIVPESGSLT